MHLNVFNTGMPTDSTMALNIWYAQERDCETNWSNMTQLSQLSSLMLSYNVMLPIGDASHYPSPIVCTPANG